MSLDTPDYAQAKYLTSAAALDQLPPDRGMEVAFIGRSNAGKSSALNVVTGIKGLARTSKTPGRTQMINLFELDKNRRLVDLPGYGYAKVPRMVQQRWEQNVDFYLKKRACLQGLVVVMDVRHPLKEMDQVLIDWAVTCAVPIHILLTKADKLSRNAAKKSLKSVTEALSMYGEAVSVQLFSSHDRSGLETLKMVLDHWYSE